ncbi:MAG TPA: ATP-binding protein [Thermoanaerobaculia bacterium]|jgi:PAS domain S-box-containing protein|nr:ATP-binding protein [Thermoanaerobaculia bacterium]
MASRDADDLLRENEELRQRLEDAEGTIRAISGDEVDAFLVRRGTEDHVLVLDGVDRPYRLLIEQMQQGAATLTSDGTVFFANQRLAELLGTPLGSLIGTRFSDYVAPGDRDAVTATLGEALQRDIYCEVAIQRGDEVFPAALAVSPLLVHESILCLLVTDLTLQKRQDHERERLLEEQVARTAAESTTAALREADRRKDEFLAILAHELRNPLGPLRNGIQLLSLAGPLEPEVRETHEMMARQVENLVRLVDDLLDVGRVTRGMIKMRKQRVDARLIVSRAVESCREFISERNHQLDIDLPDDPIPVEADLVRMAQVVVNLLKNAAKFTPAGGRILLSAERTSDSGEALIRVRDNGEGIAPEMLSKVFDLFVQADSTASRTEEGLGIGLTLSRHLTELHGGTLSAASAGLSQGSEFVIRIPLASEAEAAPPSPASGAAEAGKREKPAHRVLIVDDNLDAASSLARLLSLWGHEVREARDGTTALRIAAELRPELILLDIGLPGMNGYEVATRLRADARFRDVRIIALSGYGSEQDQARSRAAGFDAHLLKPAELSHLESILASLPHA